MFCTPQKIKKRINVLKCSDKIDKITLKRFGPASFRRDKSGFISFRRDKQN